MTKKGMEKLYTAKEVVELTGMPIPSIYRQMREGTFPHGIKIGKQSVRWRDSDLQKWLEDRTKESMH